MQLDRNTTWCERNGATVGCVVCCTIVAAGVIAIVVVAATSKGNGGGGGSSCFGSGGGYSSGSSSRASLISNSFLNSGNNIFMINNFGYSQYAYRNDPCCFELCFKDGPCPERPQTFRVLEVKASEQVEGAGSAVQNLLLKLTTMDAMRLNSFFETLSSEEKWRFALQITHVQTAPRAFNSILQIAGPAPLSMDL